MACRGGLLRPARSEWTLLARADEQARITFADRKAARPLPRLANSPRCPSCYPLLPVRLAGSARGRWMVSPGGFSPAHCPHRSLGISAQSRNCSRTGPHQALRFIREWVPGRGGNAALLSSCGLVAEPPHSYRARELL